MHRQATAKVIKKAMRNEPTIDWLLENQEKVEHYFHEFGAEGKLVRTNRQIGTSDAIGLSSKTRD